MIQNFGEATDWWAILPSYAAAIGQPARLNVHVHIDAQANAGQVSAGLPQLSTKNSVAVIGLSGLMIKGESLFGSSTSTLLARKKIRAAVNSSSVHGILLVIESPGGTVAGTNELADDIAAANKQKPVWAFCEDLCCSAAYWAASQAGKVFANKMAILGSIGAYMVAIDSSKAATDGGIKVHLVKAGEFKGAGTPGTNITAEQLAHWQTHIDQLNDIFVGAVASGRKMTLAQVRAFADGRTHNAAKATQLGLIDGVQTLEQTFSQLQAHARPKAA